MEKIEKDKVDHITVIRTSAKILVEMKNGKEYTTINLGYDDFMKDIAEAGLDDIRTQTSTGLGAFGSIATSLLSLLVFYVIIKYINGALGQLSKVAESNAVDHKSLSTFKDVAGMTEEKEELMSAITSLTSAELLKEKGVRPIKGVLLEGPPGVGKTLIAKAIAGEAGVNFLSYSGAGFSEMFMGVGTMRVKAMYKRALELKPCVVFIDEIDSVGSKRSNRGDSASKETNNTLTALLERMDGISSEAGILFIGATNRLDALDDAILRPGRFDKIIYIGPPKSKEDREAILSVHLRNKTLKSGITVEKVGKLCIGLSGAQIEGVLNDAVMESIKDGDQGIIDLPHVDKAVMKMAVRGVAKGKHTGLDRERVAIHEMGHALMNQYLNRKVIKVSIQPYSSGIGGVTQVDEETVGSNNIRPRNELINDIKVLYAGMVAEKVVLGEISTGNSNDLERATQLLHGMVSAWGMDESLLSQNYFAKVFNSTSSEEKTKAQMEALGASIFAEVETFFNDKGVKDLLISLSKQLETDEVFYELADNSIYYSSIGHGKKLVDALK
jgi:cell division protease FtsH